MNRRGFLASLLAAPFIPAPAADFVRRVTFKVSASTLSLSKFAKAKRALGSYDFNRAAVELYQAEYMRAFEQARSRLNRAVDRDIIEELGRG